MKRVVCLTVAMLAGLAWSVAIPEATAAAKSHPRPIMGAVHHGPTPAPIMGSTGRG